MDDDLIERTLRDLYDLIQGFSKKIEIKNYKKLKEKLDSKENPIDKTDISFLIDNNNKLDDLSLKANSEIFDEIDYILYKTMFPIYMFPTNTDSPNQSTLTKQSYSAQVFFSCRYDDKRKPSEFNLLYQNFKNIDDLCIFYKNKESELNKKKNEKLKMKILAIFEKYYKLIIKLIKSNLKKSYFMQRFTDDTKNIGKLYISDIYYIEFLLLDDELFNNELGKFLLFTNKELREKYEDIKQTFIGLKKTDEQQGFSSDQAKNKIEKLKKLLNNQLKTKSGEKTVDEFLDLSRDEQQQFINMFINEKFLENIKELCKKVKDVQKLDKPEDISTDCDKISDDTVIEFLEEFKTYSDTLEDKSVKIQSLSGFLSDTINFIKTNCDGLLGILKNIVTGREELKEYIKKWIKDVETLPQI